MRIIKLAADDEWVYADVEIDGDGKISVTLPPGQKLGKKCHQIADYILPKSGKKTNNSDYDEQPVAKAPVTKAPPRVVGR